MKRYLIRDKVADTFFYVSCDREKTGGVQWTANIVKAIFFFNEDEADAVLQTSIYAAQAEVIAVTVPDARVAA